MKGSTFTNDFLKLIYNATAIANLADNASSSPATNLYLSLHTADPGVAGDQTTSECAYTSYARAAVARSGSGFTVSGSSVTLAATTAFPACTSAGPGIVETATHFVVGTGSSGAGKILHTGVCGSNQGPFTAKVDDSITIPGHGLVVSDRVCFYAAPGSSLPTGMTGGTVYFVKTVSGDDITVSTTDGGTTLNLTAVGDGIAYKVSPIFISNGVTPRLTTGTTVTES